MGCLKWLQIAVMALTLTGCASALRDSSSPKISVQVENYVGSETTIYLTLDQLIRRRLGDCQAWTKCTLWLNERDGSWVRNTGVLELGYRFSGTRDRELQDTLSLQAYGTVMSVILRITHNFSELYPMIIPKTGARP